MPRRVREVPEPHGGCPRDRPEAGDAVPAGIHGRASLPRRRSALRLRSALARTGPVPRVFPRRHGPRRRGQPPDWVDGARRALPRGPGGHPARGLPETDPRGAEEEAEGRARGEGQARGGEGLPLSSIAAAPAVPRAATRAVVVKHHALVRLSHWLNVPILFGMIATGLSIYWAAPVFEHARDATTGSTDYIADLGIWIVRHVPGASGDHDPGGWVYNRVGIGTFHLALALRLHWL